MIIISEERFYNRAVYYRTVLDDLTDEIISKTRFDCRTYLLDDKKTIFIGDRLQNIRAVPYAYLNNERRMNGTGSKLQMATAIQLYYTFCDIYELDPENISSKFMNRFSGFLKGMDIESETNSPVTHRSVETVVSYLGMIYKYLEFNNFSTGELDQIRVTKAEIRTEGGSHMLTVRKRYGTELRRGYLDKLKAPTHFTPKQAKDIVDEIIRCGDGITYCLFKLGYLYGLRRGEMLGLTINDLIAHNYGEGVKYEIIIRNRLSDKPYQSAKRLLHPISQEYYNTTDYKHSQQIVPIDKNMYDTLMNCYTETRNKDLIGKEKYEALLERTKADKCSPKEEENYYIFDISGQTFNNHLKKYFKATGVSTKNVSHSLRHSCAMFYSHYAEEKVTAEQLRIILRHKSSQSTARYFNMSLQDEVMFRNKYSEELSRLIPAFKATK